MENQNMECRGFRNERGQKERNIMGVKILLRKGVVVEVVESRNVRKGIYSFI